MTEDPAQERTMLSREEFLDLYDTFKELTDGAAFEEKKAYYASKGIYPVYIGAEGYERLRGFRLGKSATAAESGSVCLEAGVHPYEATSYAGLQEVKDLWLGTGRHEGEQPLYEKIKNPDSEESKKMAGDIYLIIAGDIEQGTDFFDHATSEGGIKREELAYYRFTHPGKGKPLNRNRVIADDPGPDADTSERELYHDFHSMKKEVYSKCGANPGEKPGFITGLHTSTQPNKPSGIPLFFQFPQDEDAKRVTFQKARDYVLDYYRTTGAGYIFCYTHDEKAENYFEGVSEFENGKIAEHGVNSIIRGTYECGQDCNPETLEIARNVAFNSIAFKWGPELVAARPEVFSEPTFYSDTQTWFAPGSPKAAENSAMKPKVPADAGKGEIYGQLHLISGRELTPEKKALWQYAGKRPQGDFEDFPADLLDAFTSAKPGQLQNEAELKAEQSIAYIDIKDKNSNAVTRRTLIQSPYECQVFMAPSKPDISGALAAAEFIFVTAKYKELYKEKELPGAAVTEVHDWGNLAAVLAGGANKESRSYLAFRSGLAIDASIPGGS